MSFSHILDRLDAMPLTAGVGVGAFGSALSMSQWQSVFGIVAAGFGILLTVLTMYWRYKEHKWRMREEAIVAAQEARSDDTEHQ